MYCLPFVLLVATEVTYSLSATTGRSNKVHLYQEPVDQQSVVNILEILPAKSKQSTRLNASSEADYVKVPSTTDLALAYQAHVCTWSCLRDDSTRLFPQTVLDKHLLGISCIDCFCDDACSRFGDCCGRFGVIEVPPNDPPTFECLKVNDNGVYVISSCPGSINSPGTQSGKNSTQLLKPPLDDRSESRQHFEIRRKCESCSNESVSPITVGNRTYCNEHCLRCNEGRPVHPTDLIWNRGRAALKGAHHLLEHEKPVNAAVRECDVRWKELKAADNCSTDVSFVVNVTKEDIELFNELCKGFKAPVIYGDKLYDNIFCYLCHAIHKIRLKRLSFSLLTDLSRQLRSSVPRVSGGDDKINEDASRVERMNEGSEEIPCAQGHARFQEKGVCRKIHCTHGHNASMDVETSQWACAGAYRLESKGFRLTLAWHVLRQESVSSLASYGNKEHETSKEITGNRHPNALDYVNTTEYKISNKGYDNPAVTERVDLSFPQTPRRQFIQDHVSSGEQPGLDNDRLASLIRKFACKSLMASQHVTRFCLKSCWREKRGNSTGSGDGHDVVCDYKSDCVMNESGNESRSVYRVPEPAMTNKNQTSHHHKKTQTQQLLKRNMAATLLPQKQGSKSQEMTNNGCKWKKRNKRKHRISINVGKPEVTSEIIVIFRNTTDIDDLKEYLLTKFLGTKEFQEANFSIEVDVSMVTSSLDEGAFSWDMDDPLSELTAVSACAHVKFSASEVKKTNDGRLALTELNVTLRRYQYFEDIDNTILICVSTLNTSETAALPKEVISILEDVLTWSSLSVSFLCLFITLTTYAAIPVLRTLPGKNNMILVMYLTLAQVMLIAASYTEKGTLTCTVMGAALHYSWLATVVWMSACSFHMFHVFVVRQGAPSSDRTHWYYLVRYTVVTQFVSLTTVTVVVISSLYASSWETPGYGRNVCYLDSTLLVALGFILPLAVAVLTNIGLFSLTIYTISRLEQVKRHSKREQKNVHVYLRLSVLTGVTWSLALVAEIPGLGALRLVSIVVNGSQGVFLFVSYICNRRVLNLWRNIFSNVRLSVSARSSRNITSTTYVQ